MSSGYLILSILLMTAVTYLTRAFPFLFFLRKKPPAVFLYLERMIPPMIMFILVLYSLKDIKLSQKPHALPEAAAVIMVLLVHHWKRNSLLSIAAGTITYMGLINLFG